MQEARPGLRPSSGSMRPETWGRWLRLPARRRPHVEDAGQPQCARGVRCDPAAAAQAEKHLKTTADVISAQ